MFSEMKIGFFYIWLTVVQASQPNEPGDGRPPNSLQRSRKNSSARAATPNRSNAPNGLPRANSQTTSAGHRSSRHGTDVNRPAAAIDSVSTYMYRDDARSPIGRRRSNSKVEQAAVGPTFGQQPSTNSLARPSTPSRSNVLSAPPRTKSIAHLSSTSQHSTDVNKPAATIDPAPLWRDGATTPTDSHSSTSSAGQRTKAPSRRASQLSGGNHSNWSLPYGQDVNPAFHPNQELSANPTVYTPGARSYSAQKQMAYSQRGNKGDYVTDVPPQPLETMTYEQQGTVCKCPKCDRSYNPDETTGCRRKIGALLSECEEGDDTMSSHIGNACLGYSAVACLASFTNEHNWCTYCAMCLWCGSAAGFTIAATDHAQNRMINRRKND